MEMRRTNLKVVPGKGYSEDELDGLLPPGQTPTHDDGKPTKSRIQTLVLSCFVATFAFYFERTGFPIVFTHAAKTIGSGLDETTKGQVRLYRRRQKGMLCVSYV